MPASALRLCDQFIDRIPAVRIAWRWNRFLTPAPEQHCHESCACKETGQCPEFHNSSAWLLNGDQTLRLPEICVDYRIPGLLRHLLEKKIFYHHPLRFRQTGKLIFHSHVRCSKFSLHQVTEKRKSRMCELSQRVWRVTGGRPFRRLDVTAGTRREASCSNQPCHEYA